MKASEHLAHILSGYALEVIDSLGLQRDEDLIGSPDRLRGLLEARGWPVYEAAFAYDEAVGGITLGGKTPLGVYAALRRRERERVPHDDELLNYQGKVLLPAEGSGITELWIDAEGTIYNAYFGDLSGDDDGDYAKPRYATYTTLLERYALQTDPIWGRDVALSDRRTRYTADVRARVGAELAAATNMPPWAPATDRYASVWRDGERLVMEHPNVETNWPETEARFDTLEDVVAFWDVAEHLAPGASMRWAGRAPDAPRPGDVVMRTYRLNASDRGLRDVAVCGQHGQLRIAGW